MFYVNDPSLRPFRINFSFHIQSPLARRLIFARQHGEIFSRFYHNRVRVAPRLTLAGPHHVNSTTPDTVNVGADNARAESSRLVTYIIASSAMFLIFSIAPRLS